MDEMYSDVLAVRLRARGGQGAAGHQLMKLILDEDLPRDLLAPFQDRRDEADHIEDLGWNADVAAPRVSSLRPHGSTVRRAPVGGHPAAIRRQW